MTPPQDPLRANRWEQLRELSPISEAMFHYESSDDPLDSADLICDGCKDDWPCDFERGRRSGVLDVERLRKAIDLSGIGIAEGGHPASGWAGYIAAEYAALATPTTPEPDQ